MGPWARGITEIVKVPDLGDTPARVSRRTGVMYISMKHFEAMPKDVRYLVMAHEMAHVVLQTTDEEEADRWAFEQYAKRGYSLKASVRALTRILDESNPAHAQRMWLQWQRAKMYDYLVNGNKKVIEMNNNDPFYNNSVFARPQ